MKASKKLVNAESLMSDVTDRVNAAARIVAGILSDKQDAEVLAPVFAAVRDMIKTGKALEEVGKVQIVALLKTGGKVVTDAGSRALEAGGWRMMMKPYRRGTDPKKLLALLLGKKIPPATVMTEEKVYTLPLKQDKLEWLLKTNQITPAELKECDYEESWTLETPERMGHGG